MTILYINEEYCSSLQQLQSYFSLNFKIESSVFQDIIDYGRSGELSRWLREHDYYRIAEDVDKIDATLSDSRYFSMLSKIVAKKEIITYKIPFDQCLKYTDYKLEYGHDCVIVYVWFVILNHANEQYEVEIKSSWGLCTNCINPQDYLTEEKIMADFRFQKSSETDFEIRSIKTEDHTININNLGSLFPLYNIILGETLIEDVHLYYIEDYGLSDKLRHMFDGLDIYGVKFYSKSDDGVIDNCRIENHVKMPESLMCNFGWDWQLGIKDWISALRMRKFIIYEFDDINANGYGRILAQTPDYKYRILISFRNALAKYIDIDCMQPVSPRKNIFL